MKLAKIVSIVTIVPVIVGGIWWGAAIASDVNKNSVHTLEANMDRWTYLYLQYEQNYPAPRDPTIQAQIERWKQQITQASVEIQSRQEKK